MMITSTFTIGGKEEGREGGKVGGEGGREEGRERKRKEGGKRVERKVYVSTYIHTVDIHTLSGFYPLGGGGKLLPQTPKLPPLKLGH